MANRKEVWTTCPRGEGKKDFWLRVGTAFENRDGSWSVVLDALPVSGRLIVKEERERDDREERPARRQAPPRGRDDRDFGGDDGDLPF